MPRPKSQRPNPQASVSQNSTGENPNHASVAPLHSRGPNQSLSTKQEEPTDQHGLSKPLGKKPQPGLYVVATPIGNARDITLRALDVLRTCDVIACEDTRVTGKLLSLHDISAKLIPYHEHNAEKARPAIIKRVKNGETVALVSDAGTPVVSDPGLNLVQAFADEGLPVTALPGPSATLTALVLSGLPSDRFLFAGFLPSKSGKRKKALGELANTPATLIFLESAKRLATSLADMAEILGPRPAAVTRELTKMFEEVRRDSLEVLAETYAAEGAPKGEITIVVGPPKAEQTATAEDIDEMLVEALKAASVRDATAEVAEVTGWPKRDVYARALALKKIIYEPK
ncbi:MAG: 16S rRNA (cytidine(1402)-2'-O)-methyltransferase [Rhodospirillales bacterium]|nr:16S rRNA (cytidine(1402)-2'-O)-methyltransferase [Rhodospirillales bacterium]